MVLAAPARAEAPQVRRFENGLTWIHRTIAHNRIAAFELFLPAGVMNEPAARSGITNLTAAVWVKGTKRRSALQIAQTMEILGAAFGVDAQGDYIALGGQVIVDNWPATFDLFQDILLNPAFPAAEVDKEREAALNGIRTKKEYIFNVAQELMQKEMFGDHPYGRPEDGTEETVKVLTREDLVRWHAAGLSPQGAVLVTVGPFSARETEGRVEGLINAWRPPPGAVPDRRMGRPTASASPVPAPPYPDKPRSVEENLPFEQGFYMRGYPAPPLTHADYPKVKLINALLGAGMSSPLFRVVREEAGLAYDVSSFYPSRRAGSDIVLYAGTDPKNVDLAGQKIQSVLTDFIAKPPSASDLEDAKNLIRGHYLMDHQTNARLGWYLGWWELLGKGHGYDAVYPGEIAAATAEEVHAAARRIFAAPSVTVRVRARS